MNYALLPVCWLFLSPHRCGAPVARSRLWVTPTKATEKIQEVEEGENECDDMACLAALDAAEAANKGNQDVS